MGVVATPPGGANENAARALRPDEVSGLATQGGGGGVVDGKGFEPSASSVRGRRSPS